MGLKDWLTKNIYVTSPADKDPFFHPRQYAKPKEAVVLAVQEIIKTLPGWRVEEYRERQGLIRVSRSVMFPPSAQDINVYIVQGPEGRTGVEVTSQSRGAKGDWGRNKKNLKVLLMFLDRSLF
ncbi:MAG TPA: DUF1499 domain-containing protein [bacterium]|nr:DUF1499 domain-containing protein [bacterium]